VLQNQAEGRVPSACSIDQSLMSPIDDACGDKSTH